MLAATVAALAACGGGGGDDGGSPNPPPSAGPFAISGQAVYESIPRRGNGIGLDYAAAVDKPVRGATVQLLDDAGAALVTTTTDDAGNYAFTLTTSQPVRVRVRAEIKRTGSPAGDRDITVRDNTAGDALYVLDSSAFTPATAAVTQNVRADSGWGGSSYTAARAAAPFAILDVLYSAQAKVATASVLNLPALRVFWSVNNKPVSPINLPAGDIQTTFFSVIGGIPALVILGQANVDTDEYDTHVVAHEFGHYLQHAVSRDDTPGGTRGQSQKLDARLAFSEGWGSAFSAIALDNPVYADSLGASQGSGFSFNLGTPAAAGVAGWYSETSAQYLIYSASATTGFGPVFASMRSITTSPAFSTLYSFAAALKAASPANAAAITALWASQSIAAFDAFGTGETNSGAVPGVLPVYKTHTAALGMAQNYCVNASADMANDGNKLGEFVYIRFAFSGPRTLVVTRTSSAATTNPDFRLLKSDGSRVDAFSANANVETLATTLPAGTHAIALQDANITFSNTSCFNFTVN